MSVKGASTAMFCGNIAHSNSDTIAKRAQSER